MITQTALALIEIGKPLTKFAVPLPVAAELKDHEVLIKMTAAGLAPHDRKMRDLNYFNIGSRLPAILASDLVGTVVANGPGASFPIGTRVLSQQLFTNSLSGGLQEYTVIDGRYTGVVPTKIPDEEAALYPVAGVTSAISLFSAAGFGWPFPNTSDAAEFDYAAQKVVIIGGGTNTGKLAIQFARIVGVGTIVAIASSSSAEALISLGATHVIARQSSDIEVQVRQIVGDELLYVYDTFSTEDHSLAAPFLSNTQRGTVVHIRQGKVSDSVLAKKSAGLEKKFVQGFSGLIPEFGQQFWKRFPTWLETGQIKPSRYKLIEGLDAVMVNTALDGYATDGAGERYHVRVP